MHLAAVRRLICDGKLTAFYVGGRRLRITRRHLQASLQIHAPVAYQGKIR
jgi:hypothetical protein